jgi:hypothetical protein
MLAALVPSTLLGLLPKLSPSPFTAQDLHWNGMESQRWLLRFSCVTLGEELNISRRDAPPHNIRILPIVLLFRRLVAVVL